MKIRRKIILTFFKLKLRLESQLANEKFVANAEPEVILEKREDLNSRKMELKQQTDKLEFLKKS